MAMGIPITPYRLHVKFLGLIFQNFLWFRHIEYITNKARRKLNCLKILSGKNKCNPETILHLYKVFIRPLMTYNHAAWANCTDATLSHIQRIETAAIKYALRAPSYT